MQIELGAPPIRRSKVELYEQIRRDYEHGAGTIRFAARCTSTHEVA